MRVFPFTLTFKIFTAIFFVKKKSPASNGAYSDGHEVASHNTKVCVIILEPHGFLCNQIVRFYV